MKCKSGQCKFCLIKKGYETYLEEKITEFNSMFENYPNKEFISMDDPFHYRHKVIATFRRQKERVVLGLYQENSHDLISEENCLLQNKIANGIIKSVAKLANDFKLTVFSERSGYGLLRHLVIRVSHYNNDVLLTIVTNDDEFKGKNNFIKALMKVEPNIKSVVINQNPRSTSVVLGDKDKVAFGSGYIIDQIGNYKFRISSKSFYQVNPVQTEKLYQKAIEYADIKKTDIVMDAYSGIGTISLLASEHAKEVLGIEINKTAVNDAINNAKYNKVNNVKFIAFDVHKYIVDYKGKIDVLIVDPTRSGMDKPFIEAIKRLKPKKIVYISCNPETQIRDIRQLNKDYKVTKACGVDMFSFTKHLETIIVMTRL